MATKTAPPQSPKRGFSPPRMPNRALSPVRTPPRMQRRPNLQALPAASSARRLCITDNILDHPQFQPSPSSINNSKRRGQMRATKSCELPRRTNSARRQPVMRTNTNGSLSSIGDKTNELFAMAMSLKDNGMATLKQKLPWDPNASFSAQHTSDGLFERDLRKLSYTQRDVQSIVYEDEQAFRTLKASLRQRGCVTNAYLKENVHFYIRHVKDVRQQRINDEARRKEEQARYKRHQNLKRHSPQNAAA